MCLSWEVEDAGTLYKRTFLWNQLNDPEMNSTDMDTKSDAYCRLYEINYISMHSATDIGHIRVTVL